MFEGEVSESQKVELERNRVTIEQQLAELTELRQQLAKLSEIVDKQTNDMKQLNAEARFVIHSGTFLSLFRYFLQRVFQDGATPS